jgi:predicted nucleic acid-binding protein
VIVVDASVFIAHLDGTDAFHDRATRVLLEVADDRLAASPLTVAEVLVGPVRAGMLDEVTGALGQLAVTTVPLEGDAAVRLAVLRAATGLRMPDCCVLLAAEQVRGSLATFDERMASAARDRGIAVVG